MTTARPIVLQQVAQLLKGAQMHALSNQLLTNGIKQVAGVVRECAAEGPVVLLYASDAMFVNKQLVNQGPGVAHSIEAMRKLFERLKVHELSFEPSAGESEITAFLALFQKHWHGGTPEKMRDEAGPIRFRSLGRDEIDGFASAGMIDRRQNVLRAYARLATLMKVVVDHARERKPFKISLLRRAIQQLSEASTGHEFLLAGITRFPNLQGELHFHLMAVGALVMLMARQLELPRQALVDLVQSALLHDLARFDFKAVGADIEARNLLSLQLPTRSMQNVTTLAFTREAMIAATTAFESALPASPSDPLFTPGAAARLIAVPSFFSRLTSPQPPRRAFAADQALSMIRRRAGTVFDDNVVKLFISTVGLYPVGTTVRLSSGELAVVLQVPTDPANGTRPMVKIFRLANGSPTDAVIDLATDPGRRMVSEAVDLVESVNPMPFLLA
ncbi:MAG: hypothetical protein JNG84_09500 [Archangium sp.]|nr:hypothetical protein [Archangium sp.]